MTEINHKAVTDAIGDCIRERDEARVERDRLRGAIGDARDVIDDIAITDPGLVVVKVGKILDAAVAGNDGGDHRG